MLCTLFNVDLKQNKTKQNKTKRSKIKQNNNNKHNTTHIQTKMGNRASQINAISATQTPTPTPTVTATAIAAPPLGCPVAPVVSVASAVAQEDVVRIFECGLSVHFETLFIHKIAILRQLVLLEMTSANESVDKDMMVVADEKWQIQSHIVKNCEKALDHNTQFKIINAKLGKCRKQSKMFDSFMTSDPIGNLNMLERQENVNDEIQALEHQYASLSQTMTEQMICNIVQEHTAYIRTAREFIAKHNYFHHPKYAITTKTISTQTNYGNFICSLLNTIFGFLQHLQMSYKQHHAQQLQLSLQGILIADDNQFFADTQQKHVDDARTYVKCLLCLLRTVEGTGDMVNLAINRLALGHSLTQLETNIWNIIDNDKSNTATNVPYINTQMVNLYLKYQEHVDKSISNFYNEELPELVHSRITGQRDYVAYFMRRDDNTTTTCTSIVETIAAIASAPTFVNATVLSHSDVSHSDVSQMAVTEIVTPVLQQQSPPMQDASKQHQSGPPHNLG